MTKGGTKIYCPRCKSFSVCKAIPLTEIGEPKAQRWYLTDYQDIAWFRRGRLCLDCGHKFLSAEVDELLIDELVELRCQLAEKQKSIIRKIRRNTPWLQCSKMIPLDLAKKFIQSSAWWLTHVSGHPVLARGHADRIYKSQHGWTVDFGANKFLVGVAIERCKNVINDYLDKAAKGKMPIKSEVVELLQKQISGAVATVDGYEYAGYYPIDGQSLVFGAQSINVLDAARFMLHESGIEDILLDI